MENEGYSEVKCVFYKKDAPFKKHQEAILYAQAFDKEKITVMRKGKEINVYDWAQSTAGQNDFYENLKAYNGNVDLTIKQLSEYGQRIEPELLNIKSIEDIAELTKKSNDMWEALPLQIRAEFGNNKNNFVKNGLDWIKAKNAEYQRILAEEQAKLEMQEQDLEG